MLKELKCPFVIAMNKIDVLYQWSSKTYACGRDQLSVQDQCVKDEFQKRFDTILTQLNERGLNCAL
jgi:translation initiation factor IF-2